MYVKFIQFSRVLGVLAISVVCCVQTARAAELVMFESSICEWCDRWHEEIGPIYPKTPEGRCAPLRQVEVGDDLPSDLTDVRPVRFTPTFVVVDDGQEVARLVGYAGEDFFWYLLAEQLEKLPNCAG